MMAVEQDFWIYLRNSGLLDGPVVAELQRKLSAEPSDAAVASRLIEEGVLTAFQARRIAAGDVKHLLLGQYRITDEIGRGGFACVYKAVHAFMKRTVAIKIISPELAEDSRARTWFEREVRAVTHLCHPNIVMAYDANEIDDLLFMVMEFVDGMNLDSMVRHHGPMSPLQACAMLQQAARGLQYAHEMGLVHRDIKPANLLVPRAGAAAGSNGDVLVKIADFGLARLYNNPAGTLVLRNDKCFVGTPDYISPEQARKVHDADIRSDLYSLGCSFYFALTGQRPFRGETVLETIMMHTEKEPMHLLQLRPDLPPALPTIVHKLMAKDPDKRFQTPAELSAELAFVLGRESMASTAPTASKKATDRFPVIRPKTCAAEFQVTTILQSSAPVPTQQAMANAASESQETCAYVEHPTAERDHESTPDAVTSVPNIAEMHRSFQQRWQGWSAVIDQVATGARPRVTAEDYRNLQVELLKDTAVLAASATGSRRSLYHLVDQAVRPWLTVQNLLAAERQTVMQLRERCRLISQQLGIVTQSSWQWPTLFAGCALAAGVLGFVLFQPQWRTHVNVQAIGNAVEANPVLSLAAVVPMVVLTSVAAFGWCLRRLR